MVKIRNKTGTFAKWIKRVVLAFLVLFLIFQIHYILRITWFGFFEPSSTPYMRQEEIRMNEASLRKIQYQWVDFSQISPYLIRAVVAAEDAKFMEHSGVQWEAVREAFIANILKDRRAPGGSTLTQQTVKNLFLSHERSYLRKAEEIFLAQMMELLWSKKRILETNLNIAEFGDGIFGVEAASRYYFHKNASRLNKSESVWLASILINPKEYQNRKRTPHLNRRINRINHDMELVEVPSRK